MLVDRRNLLSALLRAFGRMPSPEMTLHDAASCHAARRVESKHLVRHRTVAALNDVEHGARGERLERHTSHQASHGGLSTAPSRWGFCFRVPQGVRSQTRATQLFGPGEYDSTILCTTPVGQ